MFVWTHHPGMWAWRVLSIGKTKKYYLGCVLIIRCPNCAVVCKTVSSLAIMIFRQPAEIQCSCYSNPPGMHVFCRCAACLPLLTQPEGLSTPGTAQINDKRTTHIYIKQDANVWIQAPRVVPQKVDSTSNDDDLVLILSSYWLNSVGLVQPVVAPYCYSDIVFLF